MVFNDTFSGTSVDVSWEMHQETADGTIADQGTTKLDIPLGSRTTTSISVTTPASGSNAVLVLQSSKNGQVDLSGRRRATQVAVAHFRYTNRPFKTEPTDRPR